MSRRTDQVLAEIDAALEACGITPLDRPREAAGPRPRPLPRDPWDQAAEILARLQDAAAARAGQHDPHLSTQQSTTGDPHR